MTTPFEPPSADALVLRTERLILRPIAVGGAPSLFPHCTDPAISRYMTWHAHTELATTETFVADSVASRATTAITSGASSRTASSAGWSGSSASCADACATLRVGVEIRFE